MNSEPKVFDQIQVYAGHPKFAPANAYVNNLEFTNKEPDPAAGIFETKNGEVFYILCKSLFVTVLLKTIIFFNSYKFEKKMTNNFASREII